MLTALSRIWTKVTNFISYNDCYTKCTSLQTLSIHVHTFNLYELSAFTWKEIMLKIWVIEKNVQTDLPVNIFYFYNFEIIFPFIQTKLPKIHSNGTSGKKKKKKKKKCRRSSLFFSQTSKVLFHSQNFLVSSINSKVFVCM